MVTVQGGYIAKQCPVVIQNRILVPTEEAELPPEAIHRMDAGIEFEAVTLQSLREDVPDGWVVIHRVMATDELLSSPGVDDITESLLAAFDQLDVDCV